MSQTNAPAACAPSDEVLLDRASQIANPPVVEDEEAVEVATPAIQYDGPINATHIVDTMRYLSYGVSNRPRNRTDWLVRAERRSNRTKYQRWMREGSLVEHGTERCESLSPEGLIDFANRVQQIGEELQVMVRIAADDEGNLEAYWSKERKLTNDELNEAAEWLIANPEENDPQEERIQFHMPRLTIGDRYDTY